MKKLLVAVSVLLLTGCAKKLTPVIDYNTEYNFKKLQSFHVLTTIKPANHSLNKDETLTLEDSKIAKAIVNSLENMGLTQQSSNQADIQVRYRVITKDKQKIPNKAIDNHGCWMCGPKPVTSYGKPSNVSGGKTYIEGTLIIDMIDSQLKKSVWRGKVSQAVKAGLSDEEQQARIQLLVDSMLVSFQANPALH